MADNCHLSQCFSIFLLQGSLPQMFMLLMESYAMIQVSVLLSVINHLNSGIGTTARNCGCASHPSQFRSVSVEPLPPCSHLQYPG